MKKYAVLKLASCIFLFFICISINAQSTKQTVSKSKSQKTYHEQNHDATPHGANDFLNYRGQRKPVESEDFYMQELITGDYIEETLIITLIFNQVLNPKSITTESVYIKNSKPYKTTAISFNKEGTKAQITVKDQIIFPVTFYITNVQSYNGKMLESVTVENLNNNESLKYNKETDQWKKY